MTTVSFYDARTRFSELLDEVGRGRQILITRRGKPAALLVPPPAEDKKDVGQIIEELWALRKGRTLPPGLTVRDMIEVGRR